MLELRTVAVIVTGVWGPVDRCDAVVRAVADHPTIVAGRIAPDEVMLIAFSDTAVGDGLTGPSVMPVTLGCLVLDVSGAWSCLVLDGPDADEAFRRLSELTLPAAGFVQGEFADVGAKIVMQTGGITILVPASVAEAVRERLDLRCADLLGSPDPAGNARGSSLGERVRPSVAPRTRS